MNYITVTVELTDEQADMLTAAMSDVKMDTVSDRKAVMADKVIRAVRKARKVAAHS